MAVLHKLPGFFPAQPLGEASLQDEVVEEKTTVLEGGRATGFPLTLINVVKVIPPPTSALISKTFD